mgnify:CR=1 FL=1
MKEKLKALDEKRLELLKARQKDLLIAGLILLGAILFCVISVITEIMPLLVVGVLLFIAALIFFAKASKHLTKYKNLVKKDLIHALLDED